MDTYETFREEIIDLCKENSACKEEFKKLVSAETEEGFCTVLKDNFHWCVKNNVVTEQTVTKYKEIFNRNSIYCNEDVKNGYLIVTGNSEVFAYGKSEVIARDNSKVHVRDNSVVYATGNSKVSARGNSKVFAYENSVVFAHENSKVYAHENSEVRARGNSEVLDFRNIKNNKKWFIFILQKKKQLGNGVSSGI
jgi:hypothetical protein